MRARDEDIAAITYPDSTCTSITDLGWLGDLTYYAQWAVQARVLLVVATAGQRFEAETSSVMNSYPYSCKGVRISMATVDDAF